MTVEAYVIEFLKQSPFGVRFIDTVRQVRDTLVERMYFEDNEGVRLLTCLMDVLTHYANFDLKHGLTEHAAIQVEVGEFIDKTGSENGVRHTTWVKIGGILAFLVAEVEQFLEIAESETARLTQNVRQIQVQ
jgi:hypothetical protein